jgi:hypothetical protein
VFDVYGTERLIAWKNIRDQLEISIDPCHDVLGVWRQAPYVNDYLDPGFVDSWPDPWRLVLDGKFDDLAINLGIVYTLVLTKRFMYEDIEIHRNMFSKQKQFYVILPGHGKILDYSQYKVYDYKDLKNSSMIYSSKINRNHRE